MRHVSHQMTTLTDRDGVVDQDEGRDIDGRLENVTHLNALTRNHTKKTQRKTHKYIYADGLGSMLHTSRAHTSETITKIINCV